MSADAVTEGTAASTDVFLQKPLEDAVPIRVRDLRKSYGALEAVKGVSFAVRKGEIFGLIGPDGAGKSSIFQILGGVMQPSDGEASILGRTPRDARSMIGYLTQTFSLYQDLSVAENLRYVGELRLLSKEEIRERSAHYLRMFDMDRFADRLAGRLSGGMKQKLALACALITEPKVLLLDEPTTGVDPVSRREFWDALIPLAARGMTILVATPYLDEAERCHRIALIHEGRIHATGTPAELRHSLGLERLEVRSNDLARAEELLRKARGIEDVQRFGDRLDVLVRDVAQGERSVRETLKGLNVTELHLREPTLENAFVATLRELEGDVSLSPFPRVRQTGMPKRNTTAISARSLSKRFGDFQAVKGVDLEVRYGEIYGLLGANGAGKTTTIKMLCGLLEPSGGTVTLAGERDLRSSSVRQRIGYMSQKFSLYDDLTIEENLDFFAGVYGVPRREREEKKRWVLSFSGLEGRERQLTGSLPGGWKQRVAFGAAIMHEPEVLFLDEPTSGVDPLARRALWRMINDLADYGVAILVTTHYLEEAEQCNRLGLMVAGYMVAQGSPSDLKTAQRGTLIELITDEPQLAMKILRDEMERWRVSLFGDRLHVVVDEDEDTAIKKLADRLKRNGIDVVRAYREPFSLEDVFIQTVERARREGKVAPED
jgi:ABC-2 type transport system ATP-binding protein